MICSHKFFNLSANYNQNTYAKIEKLIEALMMGLSIITITNQVLH